MIVSTNKLKASLISFTALLVLCFFAASTVFADVPAVDDTNRSPSDKNICEGRSVGESFKLDGSSSYVVCGPEARKFQLASSLFGLVNAESNWALREQLPVTCNNIYPSIVDWGYWTSGPGIALAEPNYDTSRSVQGVDVNFEIWQKGHNVQARTWAICDQYAPVRAITGTASGIRATAAVVRGYIGRATKGSDGKSISDPKVQWRWGIAEDQLINKTEPTKVDMSGHSSDYSNSLMEVGAVLQKLPENRKLYYQLVYLNGNESVATGEVRSFKTRAMVGGELNEKISTDANSAQVGGTITVDPSLKDKQLKWYIAYGPCDTEAKEPFCDPKRYKTAARDLDPASGEPVESSGENANAPKHNKVDLGAINLKKLEAKTAYVAQIVIYEDHEGQPVNIVTSDAKRFKTEGADPSTNIAQVIPYANMVMIRVNWKGSEGSRHDDYSVQLVELDSNGNEKGARGYALTYENVVALQSEESFGVDHPMNSAKGSSWYSFIAINDGDNPINLRPNTTYKVKTVVRQDGDSSDILTSAGDEAIFTTRRGPDVKLSVGDETTNGAKVFTSVNANEQDGVGANVIVFDARMMEDIAAGLTEDDYERILDPETSEEAQEEIFKPAIVANVKQAPDSVTGARFESFDLDLDGKLQPGRDYVVTSSAVMQPRQDARTGNSRIAYPYRNVEQAVIRTPAADSDLSSNNEGVDGFDGGNGGMSWNDVANGVSKLKTNLSIVNQTGTFDGSSITFTLRCTLSKGSCRKGSVSLEGVGTQTFAPISAGKLKQISFPVASKMRSELQQYLVSNGEIPADLTIKAGNAVSEEQVKLVAQSGTKVPNTPMPTVPSNPYQPSAPVTSPALPYGLFNPNGSSMPTGYAPSTSPQPNLGSLLGSHPQSQYPGGMGQPIGSGVAPAEASAPALLALAHKAGSMASRIGETIAVVAVPFARSTIGISPVAAQPGMADGSAGIQTAPPTPAGSMPAAPGAPSAPSTPVTPGGVATPTSSATTDAAALSAAEHLGEVMGSPAGVAEGAVNLAH